MGDGGGGVGRHGIPKVVADHQTAGPLVHYDARDPEGTSVGDRAVYEAGVAGGIAFPILPALAARDGVSILWVGVILAANRFGRIAGGPLAPRGPRTA